jgi:[citrate (pro-3S)-lyase] ligase
MLDNITFSRISIAKSEKLIEVRRFLTKFDLSIDKDVEYFVVAYNDNRQVIACGGLAGAVLKSIAVASSLKGSGFSLKLMSELTNFAYEMGRYNLFLFTKPENICRFRQAGFFLIEKVEGKMALLENSPNRLASYKKTLAKQKVTGEKIGSIVMNANPFTLGHQYLIEKACNESNWIHLFVVGEEGKDFSYNDRLSMIKSGTKHITNITIHSGSDYIISKATFPSYFIKDQKIINYCHTALDLKLFRKAIAPMLGITHRYVGTEPLCPVTSNYNQAMHQWLELEPLGTPAIEVIQVPRKVILNEPVSASRVRRLIQEGQIETVRNLVPTTTFQFLSKRDITQTALKPRQPVAA